MKAGFAPSSNHIFSRLHLPSRLGFGTEKNPMKRLTLISIAALTALTGRAALPQPDLIAEIHFAGGDKIAGDKNYSSYKTEFSSAEALALRKQTADRLAPWLSGWLQKNVGVTVAEGALKLRPLFDDLQAAEWYLEARAAAGDKPDVALAIKISADRVPLWQASLKPFFPAATFKQSAGWLIFDSGTGASKAGDILARKISAPPAGWLDMDVNWPRLAQWYPALKDLDLPETLFNVTAPNENLHINGKFFFPENVSSKLETWQFPSNTVHQPLVGFTAARGFAGWLNGQAWAQPVKFSPPANQIFIWAMAGLPFQSFAAVPVPDSAAALRQLDAGLQPVMADRNARKGFIAPFTLSMTNDQLTLLGAPVMAPYVRAVKEPSGQYLLAGGFANPLKSKPLPPELFQALAAPNLVFYHWEITAERLPLLANLSQLTLLLTRHKQMDGTTAAYEWIDKIGPTLGNTDTEITQTAPDQFTFTRKAPGGLTAFELFALASWLEAPDFPHCDLKLGATLDRPKVRIKKPHAAPAMTPGAPAPGN